MRIYFNRNNFNYDWWSLTQSYLMNVKPEHTVLEIGASVPERTRQLASKCRRLLGVELFKDRMPAPEGNIEYVNADWQELSKHVPENSIDIAISSHVIEHVTDDLKALNELFKVLKPGGIALINTPNRKRLTRAVIELFTGERKFPYWEHQREYVENDLERLLAASSFRTGNIIPIVFGIHGGPVFCYMEEAPASLRKFANYWEVHLTKKA